MGTLIFRALVACLSLLLFAGHAWAVVELVSFSANPTDGAMQLLWQTASESNNDYFEIVRDSEHVYRIASLGDSPTGHAYSYADSAVVSGGEYAYSLWAVDDNGDRDSLGTVSATLDVTPRHQSVALPTGLTLSASPNPFNSSTRISFTLGRTERVELMIFNAMGQKIQTLANGTYPAGRYAQIFDACGLPSGFYFCSLATSSGFHQTMKMLLLK